jgi:hypothetical protein
MTGTPDGMIAQCEQSVVARAEAVLAGLADRSGSGDAVPGEAA